MLSWRTLIGFGTELCEIALRGGGRFVWVAFGSFSNFSQFLSFLRLCCRMFLTLSISASYLPRGTASADFCSECSRLSRSCEIPLCASSYLILPKEGKKERKGERMEGTKIGSFLFFFFPKFEILRKKWKAKKNFEESKKPSKNVLKNNNSIRDSSKGFILGGFRTLFLKG